MPTSLELWIRRLRESDIDARRDAIRQLELLGDPAALAPLAVIFALDPDLETRKLAQQAGKSIYTATERRMAAQSGPSGASEEERRKAAEILAKAQNRRKR